jgi:hypothetical protein
MGKQIFILLAVAMLLPSAIAFNCNSLSGGDLQVCNSIQDTNLSKADKDLLIADIFNPNKTTPNFDFVYQWNTNLNIPNSPDGSVHSAGTIKEAWIKIMALMPSIIENNILYASKNGKLMTAYNYKASLPSGTESGDCKTSYHSLAEKETLNVYLNDNLIGNNKISSYIINSNPDNLNFVSKLNIQSSYYADHYKTKKYCSKYDKKGNCIKYSTKCQFSYTEKRTDTLTLSGSFNAKLYKSQINSSFKITNQYSGITQGVLTATNYSQLILSFNNSFYQENKYLYSLNYTLPYYVLTLKAEPIETSSFNNIHIEKNQTQILFNVKDSSNCQVKISDYFSSQIKSCDLSFNKINFSIQADKTIYFENDTIKVYIYPNDVLVNITYGNQSKLAKNYTEFKAVIFENIISAKLNNSEASWLIAVNKKEQLIVLYNLGVLGFLGYFFYKAAKNYYLKFNF